MAQPCFAALAVELIPEDWAGPLTVRTALDGSVINGNVRDFRNFANRHLETLELHQVGADAIFLRARTNQSLIHIAEAARTRLYRNDTEVGHERRTEVLQDMIVQEIDCTAVQNEPLTIEKIVALCSSLDHAISEPGLEAKRMIFDGGRFDELFSAHRLAWSHLWEECDVSLSEHATPGTDLKLRLDIFHILQTVSPHTLPTAMSACRRVAGMARAIAATSSGTSSMSSRS
jgi:alpha,alpha-trehalase